MPQSRLLVVGSGDVARRAMPLLCARYRVYCLVRDPGRFAWGGHGAVAIEGDLDRVDSLARAATVADCVLHLAPPPDAGTRDTRTRHLLAAFGRAGVTPRRLIYVSTSGVYGDCGGALVNETRSPRPGNARGTRRQDAEAVLRAWGRRTGCTVAVLRAPGIYAAERLPLARLDAGLPSLVEHDDVWSNHVHADDLGAACCAALVRGRPQRIYHVCDDQPMKAGTYFDLVADRFGRKRPPRLPRDQAQRVLSPGQMSFLRESRRLDNTRLKRELRVRLAYPSVAEALSAMADGKGG